MITFRDIKTALRGLKATYPHTDIAKNADSIRISKVEVEELEDEEGDIYKRLTCIARRFSTKKKGSGLPREVIIHIYGKGSNPLIQCACSCEWFLYYCEYALNSEGGLPYQESDMINNGAPDITNEGLELYACKHIFHVLSRGYYKKEPTKKARKKGSRKREESKEIPRRDIDRDTKKIRRKPKKIV